MQWHGSTNKSPTKLNAAKIKFDTIICLQMGKTTKAKNPSSDFKVTTLKTSIRDRMKFRREVDRDIL